MALEAASQNGYLEVSTTIRVLSVFTCNLGNLKYFLIWVPKTSNDCTSVVGSRGRNVMSMVLLDTRHLSSQSKWTSGGQ